MILPKGYYYLYINSQSNICIIRFAISHISFDLPAISYLLVTHAKTANTRMKTVAEVSKVDPSQINRDGLIYPLSGCRDQFVKLRKRP